MQAHGHFLLLLVFALQELQILSPKRNKFLLQVKSSVACKNHYQPNCFQSGEWPAAAGCNQHQQTQNTRHRDQMEPIADEPPCRLVCTTRQRSEPVAAWLAEAHSAAF